MISAADYSVRPRVVHTSSSPSNVFCCSNLMVQLLVLPFSDKEAWVEIASVNHELHFITSTKKLLSDAEWESCRSTLAKRSPACITITVARTSAFIFPYLPVLKHVDSSALSHDPDALLSPGPSMWRKKLIKCNKRPSTWSHCLLS